MGDNSAFFYGTLMAREVLYRCIYGDEKLTPVTKILAAQLTHYPAILHDHSRQKILGADYPGVVSEKGRSVRGIYVTGLTDGDIWRLDIFEGEEYTRTKVAVNLLIKDGEKEVEGEEKATETYIYTQADVSLEKVEWDYEEFRREKMWRWANTSEEYAEVDAATATAGHGDHDPTGGRGKFASAAEEDKKEILESAV
ncbi:related to disease resistance protein aig2 [Rhynchosporium secalis]|uniref:Putative gamma-glutamylcyclotransferase n=1 Tax=Rhynchosporium secalis TaxID=38038 RepID=A0A1E1MJL1_RHYSE|nr:related to disease resistance protein aig2 [Rhynchosporium secalis]